MINELLSTSGKEVDLYYDFLLEFLPKLKSYGVCQVLDVTTKLDEANKYYPQIMNEQVNRALNSIEGYATIIPLPCNLYAGMCCGTCFTQKTMYVSHSRKSADKTKVCYRVIGRKEFVKKIGNPMKHINFSIRGEREYCPFGEKVGQAAADAFMLCKDSFSKEETGY